MKNISSKSTYSIKPKTIQSCVESRQKKTSRVIKSSSLIKLPHPPRPIDKILKKTHSNANQNHHNINKLQSRLQLTEEDRQKHKINKINSFDKQSNLEKQRNHKKQSIETVKIHSSKIENLRGGYNEQEKMQNILKENEELKQKCFQFQECNIRDKEKIKSLILRINDIKKIHLENNNNACEHVQSHTLIKTLPLSQNLLRNATTNFKTKFSSAKPIQETPCRELESQKKVKINCQNEECQENRKYLEQELYRERINLDKLLGEKKQCEQSRDALRYEYRQLLKEVQVLKESE